MKIIRLLIPLLCVKLIGYRTKTCPDNKSEIFVCLCFISFIWKIENEIDLGLLQYVRVKQKIGIPWHILTTVFVAISEWNVKFYLLIKFKIKFTETIIIIYLFMLNNSFINTISSAKSREIATMLERFNFKCISTFLFSREISYYLCEHKTQNTY